MTISLHIWISLHFSTFLFISRGLHFSRFLHYSSFLFISLHFSTFICISLHFSAFLCISLHFLHFTAFYCISLRFFTFLYIFLYFSAFYVLGQFDRAYHRPMDAIFLFLVIPNLAFPCFHKIYTRYECLFNCPMKLGLWVYFKSSVSWKQISLTIFSHQFIVWSYFDSKLCCCQKCQKCLWLITQLFLVERLFCGSTTLEIIWWSNLVVFAWKYLWINHVT